MISEFIYTSTYPNIHIIQMHAVARYGLDISDVAATFLIVTATMQMMIYVIILAIIVINLWLNHSKLAILWSSVVLKDVAL